jgi:hypothetical protein
VNRVSPAFRQLEDALSAYITIVGPFIHALWALEATRASASDVFIFWAAIGHVLLQLQSTPSANIPTELLQKVIAIYNHRYDKFFSASDIYFVAFVLDPSEQYIWSLVLHF